MFKLYSVKLKHGDAYSVASENISMVAGMQYVNRRTYEAEEVQEIAFVCPIDFVLATPQANPVVDPPLSTRTTEDPFNEVLLKDREEVSKAVDQGIANAKLKQDAEQEKKYFDWLAENLAKRGFAVPQADGSVHEPLVPHDFGGSFPPDDLL